MSHAMELVTADHFALTLETVKEITKRNLFLCKVKSTSLQNIGVIRTQTVKWY